MNRNLYFALVGLVLCWELPALAHHQTIFESGQLFHFIQKPSVILLAVISGVLIWFSLRNRNRHKPQE